MKQGGRGPTRPRPDAGTRDPRRPVDTSRIAALLAFRFGPTQHGFSSTPINHPPSRIPTCGARHGRAGGGHTLAAAAPTFTAAFKSLAENAPVPEWAAEATRAAA